MVSWSGGSPVEPATIEAIIVHRVDNLDAKKNANLMQFTLKFTKAH